MTNGLVKDRKTMFIKGYAVQWFSQLLTTKVMIYVNIPWSKYVCMTEMTLPSVANEKERFIEYINAVLEDWTFDRLGYLEQSILLLACAEFDCKEISAQVIMDEAINLTKSYCDDNTYKLINGVLDRL